MIDIEFEIFDMINSELQNKYPSVYVTSEYIKSPSSFPCVSFSEVDNQIYEKTRTSSCIENHASLLYEVNVYSNKRNGKKVECKKIISIIDNFMGNIGFTRVFLNPIPNEDDATIYRMVARYRAVVSKNKVIYRR